MGTARLDFTVTDQDTASALGSGDLAVLATPRLLAWCEAATCRAAEDLLPAGSTSVGTRVQLDHLQASAVGSQVAVRADLVHTDGRLLEFEVTAVDQADRVLATGRVRRVAVDRLRFLARLAPAAGGPVP
jgi:predicted thioesterase